MTSSPLHHSLDYVELVVTDLDAAKHFYADAFDWTFNDYGPGYAGIASPSGDGTEVGGLLLADEPRPAGGPLVLLYSENLDATAKGIVAAGGSILQEAYAFPGGRRLHFADPSGNELGVWSSQ
ncbi:MULTISPECIES: VOC family protein [unclassified Microbacterium]|uniref:VOC family protein n=1 Tax=unclassified Microbacterium TaxID=2609290 RepID=UPI00301894D6